MKEIDKIVFIYLNNGKILSILSKEKNPYFRLKDISAKIYYLNTASKGFFTKKGRCSSSDLFIVGREIFRLPRRFFRGVSSSRRGKRPTAGSRPPGCPTRSTDPLLTTGTRLRRPDSFRRP